MSFTRDSKKKSDERVSKERKKSMKKPEVALGRSKETDSELVENIKDLIYILDKIGIITYISPAIESILGVKSKDLIEKPYTDFIHEDDYKILFDPIDDLISAKRIFNVEFIKQTKDGHYIPVEGKGAINQKDGNTKLIGVVQDISERRRAKDKLKESEKE
jgi:PAS domain S-box-containing protein